MTFGGALSSSHGVIVRDATASVKGRITSGFSEGRN